MKKCYAVNFITPDRLQLDGLWFGSEKAKTGFIFIHGLSSSAFSKHELSLGSRSSMTLYFSNRGHDEITGIKQIHKRSKEGYKWFSAGKAHEVFTDCVHDIQGAVDFLTSKGIKEVFLVGHSTGCQKAIYYLSQNNNQKYIKGVVLLCPLSDYAYAQIVDPVNLKKATRQALKMVKEGKGEELLPEKLWSDIVDAQRFLSLFTPDSAEEIFTYSHPEDKPSALKKVKIPMLAVLAAQDEYGRPIKDILDWFNKEHSSTNFSIKTVDAPHDLSSKSDEVVDIIDNWWKSL